VDHAILYQDNRSAILLELYGKSSSEKRMKHIVTEFFILKTKWSRGCCNQTQKY